MQAARAGAAQRRVTAAHKAAAGRAAEAAAAVAVVVAGAGVRRCDAQVPVLQLRTRAAAGGCCQLGLVLPVDMARACRAAVHSARQRADALLLAGKGKK